jgi:hypothetical protein
VISCLMCAEEKFEEWEECVVEVVHNCCNRCITVLCFGDCIL